MRVVEVWPLSGRPFPAVKVERSVDEGTAVGDVLEVSRDGERLGQVTVRGIEFHGHLEDNDGARDSLLLEGELAADLAAGDILHVTG